MEIESQEIEANTDKTFIDVILGEMKNQFNKTEKRNSPELINFTTEEEVYNNGNADSNLDLKIKTEDVAEITDTTSEEAVTIIKIEEVEEGKIELNCKVEDSIIEEESESNKEDIETPEEQEEKPRIVLTFRKPTVEDNVKTKKNSEGGVGSGRRTLRAKLQIVDDDKLILKRSARRRSRDCNESVLQSAIARKEKSYNEASKPQRLTRQLKATPKILENLANAALKLEKNRSDKSKLQRVPEKHKINENGSDNDTEDNMQSESDLENDRTYKKTKHKLYKSKHSVKRYKNVHSDLIKDSDSDHSSIHEDGGLKYNCNACDGKSKIYKTRASTEDKSCRRSHRLSSRNKEDSSTNDDTGKLEISVGDQDFTDPSDLEMSHQTSVRPCLCTQKTQFYISTAGDGVIYCTAIDNIGDKLIGCSRVVNGNEVSMMRPSTRVPYIILCEVHLNRMLRHNCCPKCGLFCTQGQFVQCERRHQYHRECQITQGDVDCCPHCGLSSPDFDILVTMHSSRKPIFLPQQKSYQPSAKMSFHYERSEDMEENDLKITPVTSTNLISLSKLDVSDSYDINSLVESVKAGDHEKLGIILGQQQNLKINTVFDEFHGGSVLHYAAENNMLTVVHLLVLAGAEVDVLNKDQNTPIVCAILAFKNSIVKYLIKAGASIYLKVSVFRFYTIQLLEKHLYLLKGTDGMTALHLAAKSGNLTACKLLLESSSRTSNYVNVADDGGWTPLVWACEHGHFEIAKYLLHKSADPLLRDVEQNIALHWAAFSGSSDIAELLLNYKSDINAVNAYGDTPLHIGARQNTYDCILILLIRGANVHLKNKTDELPLDCALPASECYNIISLNAYLHSLTTSDEKLSIQVVLCNDISRGQEKNPIQCVNILDDEEKPSDFIYVSVNCITSDDINIDRKISSVHSCACEERCSSFACVCCNNSLQCWYDEDGKLITHFNYLDPPMIFECNQLCNCNAIICNNRVVQHGLTTRFQLFKTNSRGWAVRTLCNISKGTFVCEYIGEIITDVEADRREDDSYVFDLDSRDSDAFCIDAKRYGNFARFINHSCDANLVPIRVFIEHQDIRFPRIAFFANRDISAEEELSFDYGERFWIIKYKSFTCTCGTANCKYSEETIATTVENYNKRVEEAM
ncbi:hypothetical protein RN001_004897 [Aquatica leii]|uniref:Histone-lysine N-methyltransferase EHMT2 n=1 Tax=Aquatica leii TaxID=1421715 RepID=A0AAN7SPP5_9COLE|nr:hypothetical protein RN001_004897 [Aquatica leii]